MIMFSFDEGFDVTPSGGSCSNLDGLLELEPDHCPALRLHEHNSNTLQCNAGRTEADEAVQEIVQRRNVAAVLEF